MDRMEQFAVNKTTMFTPNRKFTVGRGYTHGKYLPYVDKKPTANYLFVVCS
jgi:hypothetical protein